ncbi:hypothetical protein [Glutamicibacter endophyticus]|uniref:hypothetical protein n=1 Tax=Glutamicibacter endophyticus TaxID=1522174 RepID=UPI003AF0B614
MSVTYLLVHSPLVGPATWDALAADLRADGHRVTIPDLRDTLEGGPPYCARQVAAAGPRGPQRGGTAVAGAW